MPPSKFQIMRERREEVRWRARMAPVRQRIDDAELEELREQLDQAHTELDRLQADEADRIVASLKKWTPYARAIPGGGRLVMDLDPPPSRGWLARLFSWRLA